MGRGCRGSHLFVFWGGPWLFTQHPSHGLTAEQELKAKNDVRTTLVQSVGLLALLGGVISYRNQRLQQHDQARAAAMTLAQQITDTYTKTVDQLGHAQAQVRSGALYTLESLAQENPARRPDHRQHRLRLPPDALHPAWAKRVEPGPD